jgi:heme/copper-type cytochrome/quinol oxidase subunit 1
MNIRFSFRSKKTVYLSGKATIKIFRFPGLAGIAYNLVSEKTGFNIYHIHLIVFVFVALAVFGCCMLYYIRYFSRVQKNKKRNRKGVKNEFKRHSIDSLRQSVLCKIVDLIEMNRNK